MSRERRVNHFPLCEGLFSVHREQVNLVLSRTPDVRDGEPLPDVSAVGLDDLLGGFHGILRGRNSVLILPKLIT